MNDFKIDVPLSEILGNLNNEPIEISLNTNELPDGPVAVSVSICDCNDNCTESPPIDYTIDNTLSLPDTVNINSVILKMVVLKFYGKLQMLQILINMIFIIL